MYEIGLAEMRFSPLGDQGPGTFVLIYSRRDLSPELAVVVEGGRVIRGNLLLTLSGDESFVVRPIRSPEARCLVLPFDEPAFVVPQDSREGQDARRTGSLVLEEESSYLNVLLAHSNFNPDPHVVDLTEWQLVDYLREEKRLTLDNYSLTARNKLLKKRVELLKASGEREYSLPGREQ